MAETSARQTDGGTQAVLSERLRQYALLMRLDRPIGTLLLLWPSLWALWIAGAGRPDVHVLIVFVAGVFVMRSAGCVINDYADRRIDPHVRRTRNRPLATGRVRTGEALALLVVLLAVALALVLTLNRLTLLLAFVGAALALSYPFTKRFTSLPQFYLGVAFGWSVPMAFAAQSGSVPALAWFLFAAVVLWAAAYDTIYAMVDREDDLRIGVRSTAILFGRADRAMIGVLQFATLTVLWHVGQRTGLGGWYWAGLAGAGVHALVQQAALRTREPAKCFQAFLSNNSFGALIFAGIALHYVFA